LARTCAECRLKRSDSKSRKYKLHASKGSYYLMHTDTDTATDTSALSPPLWQKGQKDVCPCARLTCTSLSPSP